MSDEAPRAPLTTHEEDLQRFRIALWTVLPELDGELIERLAEVARAEHYRLLLDTLRFLVEHDAA